MFLTRMVAAAVFVAAAPGVAQTSVAASDTAAITPIADHHVHLISDSVAEVFAPTPQKVLDTYPAELDRLLKAREFPEGATLKFVEGLYTDDAVMRSRNGGGWVGGKRRIVMSLGDYVLGYKLKPVAYDLAGTEGYVAGYFERGGRLGATFQFSLKRVNGEWRIAVDNIIPVAPTWPAPVEAPAIIAELDAAGIKQGVVMSLGYILGGPSFAGSDDEEGAVRAENDWAVAQVAKFPGRLITFCGVNPVKDYAVREMERCSKIPQVKGMKMHLDNSKISLKNPADLKKLRTFFAAANRLRMPIGAHVQAGSDYGPEYTNILLKEVFPAAPDITIQIMHMAGSGPGYSVDAAFEVLAKARASRDPRMKNIYVDVASIAHSKSSPAQLALIATRLREFGLDHVLFGSDRAPGIANEDPKTAWEAFRRVPLTDAEFRQIAQNVAPYFRCSPRQKTCAKN